MEIDTPTAQAGAISDIVEGDTAGGMVAVNITWNAGVAFVVLGYIVLSIYHRESWTFLLSCMFISTWTYGVMVFKGGVPLVEASIGEDVNEGEEKAEGPGFVALI